MGVSGEAGSTVGDSVSANGRHTPQPFNLILYTFPDHRVWRTLIKFQIYNLQGIFLKNILNLRFRYPMVETWSMNNYSTFVKYKYFSPPHVNVDATKGPEMWSSIPVWIVQLKRFKIAE